MTCRDILEQLVQQFESCRGGHDRCPGRDNTLAGREIAQDRLQEFQKLFPFREKPVEIQLLNAGGVCEFLHWFWFELSWLGSIKTIPIAQPCDEAAANIAQFQRLLRVAADDTKTLAEKIDAPWDAIKRFGSDRHIAKKMVATYYPKTLPIFSAKQLEYHANQVFNLGVRVRDEDPVGQKWELLTRALLERKDHHETTRNEDYVYFMYILEHNLPSDFRKRN